MARHKKSKNGDNNSRTPATAPLDPSLSSTSSSIPKNETPHPPPTLATTAPAAPHPRPFSPTASSLPITPLQRSGSERTTPPSRAAENSMHPSIYLHPSDGYNHSKVVKTAPMPSTTYEPPSWLKDMSQSKILTALSLSLSLSVYFSFGFFLFPLNNSKTCS